MEEIKKKKNKRIFKKERLKENGITLVALVVSIIIIIILATVTINMAFGDNGLITQAQKAKDMTANSVVTEQEEMNSLMDEYANLMAEDSEITEPTPPVETPSTDGTFSAEEGVNTPNIGNNMQLVVFDTNSNTWKEDTTKEAYSYLDTSVPGNENKSEWANAKVTIDGIDSYFVWIPRYAYKITYYTDDKKETTSSTPTAYGTIDIKFINGTGNVAADGTVCKYASEKPDATQEYVVHPAFTTDEDQGGGWDNELAGIWIGKYEASLANKSDGSNIVTKDNSIGNILLSASENTNKTIVTRPGYYSWTYCTVGNMYTNAKVYSKELKSHMLKNSEWGAIAYLTDSKYGRNSTEIEFNDYGYVTGGGIDNAYMQNVLQSTTGNIYGIYDLRGGAYEYVAAYLSGYGTLVNGTSFANGISDEYSTAYTEITAREGYKYGDATYETNAWYEDENEFVFSTNDSFFVRGGACVNEESMTGIFFFTANSRTWCS